MECVEIKFGSNDCTYNIQLPYSREGLVSIDKCLLPEILKLWEMGIKTTGCCCGHGRAVPFIGVTFDDIDKMKALGYIVWHNSCRPNDEDSFIALIGCKKR
jgi:hypothetical protein